MQKGCDSLAVDKMQYIGKRLTWDEAVDIFPDLWVAFKDCKMSGIDFENGILVDVIADQDLAIYMKQNSIVGYIHGEIKEKTFQ